MTKQQHVAKAVLRHDWASLEDWVGALDDLADLSDDQIEQLEVLPPGGRRKRIGLTWVEIGARWLKWLFSGEMVSRPAGNTEKPQ